MKYRDYLEAAKRHSANCNFNLKRLSDSNEFFDVNVRKALEINTYYLSGYIVECSLSYALLHTAKYSIDKPVSDLREKPFKEIKWDFYLREHNFDCQKRKYQKIIEELGGNSTELEQVYDEWRNSQVFVDLIKSWDSKIRYTNNHLGFEVDYHKLKTFTDLSNKMLTKIKKL